MGGDAEEPLDCLGKLEQMRPEELDIADFLLVLAGDLREELVFYGVLGKRSRWVSCR